MSSLQPVIKWSGSKRSQAEEIISYFPRKYNNYYEPFVGGGSILGRLNPDKAIVGDSCTPLIKTWGMIKNNPQELSHHYRREWLLLQEDKSHYYKVRERFNNYQDPKDFLFLTRTAFNGLIRFNKNGDFNSSYHTNRPGINPDKLDKIIIQWNNIIKNVRFLNSDCFVTCSTISPYDLVYLDPPYANIKGMYGDTFTVEKLYELLEFINSRNAYYVLSFDGKTNKKDNTVNIPKELYKNNYYMKSYNSSFSRLKGNNNTLVSEALYTNF